MVASILIGNCIDVLRTMPARSVHMVCTSPPYWGLRCYGTEPQVWGGQGDCAHRWGDVVPGDGRRGQRGHSSIMSGRQVCDSQIEGTWCQRCGAWRGEHGQEPTLALWLANELAIFAEVRRVLLTAKGAEDCEDCGSRIKAARRRAMPSARTCAPCQTERETPRRDGGQ